jgi:hypothetical protein
MAAAVKGRGVTPLYYARCRRCRALWGPFKSLARVQAQPSCCKRCR